MRFPEQFNGGSWKMITLDWNQRRVPLIWLDRYDSEPVVQAKYFKIHEWLFETRAAQRSIVFIRLVNICQYL